MRTIFFILILAVVAGIVGVSTGLINVSQTREARAPGVTAEGGKIEARAQLKVHPERHIKGAPVQTLYTFDPSWMSAIASSYSAIAASGWPLALDAAPWISSGPPAPPSRSTWR